MSAQALKASPSLNSIIVWASNHKPKQHLNGAILGWKRPKFSCRGKPQTHLKRTSNAPPSLNSIIFCASTHSPHSKLWLCRSWYSTSMEYQLFIATGLLFNKFQVENCRSFGVRSSLESVPELEFEYFLSFESLSSFKFVIMQKLVFYLDGIPTF